MNGELEAAWLAEVREAVDLLLPDRILEEDWQELLKEVLASFGPPANREGTYPERIARVIAAGYDLAGKVQFNLLVEPQTPKTNQELARKLFNACSALTAGTPAEGPIPVNKFMVTKVNDEFEFWNADCERVNREGALLLAVWLIALADPTLSDAVPMLLRVATR